MDPRVNRRGEAPPYHDSGKSPVSPRPGDNATGINFFSRCRRRAHGPRTRHGYGVAFRLMRAYSMSTRHIRVFDLQPNGTLARQTDRVFCSEPGDPDGMKVDSAGNVYCGGSGGLYIID